MWKQLSDGKKTALVLAGGGARGAYEVGAIQALAEAGFEPAFVAGTSIGALNGSMVAQETDLIAAGEMLGEAWHQLGDADIIRPDYWKIIGDLAMLVGASASKGAQRIIVGALPKLSRGQDRGYLDTGPVDELLQRWVNPERLRRGRDFWIAMTKLLSNTSFPFRHIVESARAYSAKDVEYIEPGSLADEELFSSLLASSAIPIAFPSQRVGSGSYLDGGIVDNVPIQAIRKFGCGLIVVIHLSNGSLWDRREFDELNVLEIRPTEEVQKEKGFKGWVDSLIDFQPESIERLRDMGKRDTQTIVEDLKMTVDLHVDANKKRARTLETTRALIDDESLTDG